MLSNDGRNSARIVARKKTATHDGDMDNSHPPHAKCERMCRVVVTYIRRQSHQSVNEGANIEEHWSTNDRTKAILRLKQGRQSHFSYIQLHSPFSKSCHFLVPPLTGWIYSCRACNC